MSQLKGGAKAKAVLDPLPTKGLPKATPERIIRWIERFIIVPKGFGSRKPMKLANFQKQMIREIFSDTVVRSAVASLPRGQGKTSLSAALALFALFDESVDDPEVLAVASDERTAEILLNTCKRMCELNPLLAERVVLYMDKITCPGTNGVLMALPSRETALHGRSPSYLSLDELHLCSAETWEACVTASGKREKSLVVAISTPATTRDSVMYQLVEHGRTDSDPTFRLIEHAAPNDCAIDDEVAWRIGNPAIDAGFLSIDGLRSTLKVTRPARFRQLRLGQWVDSDDAWISFDQWMALTDLDRVVSADEPIVLGWDGSISNDASCLIGCTVPQDIDEKPHLFVVGIWERNKLDPNWQVPREEVDQVVRTTMANYNVQALCADPYFWQAEIQRWNNEFGNVIEWNTASPQRMARGADALYAAYKSQNLSHCGNATLALHAANVVTRDTPHGVIPVKRSKNSQAKIDALIAALIAHSHAVHLSNQPKEQTALGGIYFV